MMTGLPMDAEHITPTATGAVDIALSTAPVAGAIVTTIERAWSAIQFRHPDVPDVVVTMGQGSGQGRPGTLRLGHFAAGRWAVTTGTMHELFVGGEGLRRGAVDVLGTLLHEAAHGAAAQRGVQDTSRQGRYHNAKYKQIGEEFGLTLERDPQIGWSLTSVPEHTAAAYSQTLADLEAVLVAYRHAEDSDELGGAAGAGKSKPGTTMECGCGRKVRAARSVAELGAIVCGRCGTEFTFPADEDGDEIAS